jgi:pimeloyl-ACP methyl ester carboxylesterase
MRISLGDVTLWFDLSGPSVVPRGDTAVERPTLVAVHGGPGLDHINMKAGLAPLAESLQILFYDQRGHGRSDHGTAGFWNLRTWADDLRRLCDALGLSTPVVLGSSFGGFVALAYAGLFPAHPGGIILAKTTGGRPDHRLSVEIFRRLGGDEAAARPVHPDHRREPALLPPRSSALRPVERAARDQVPGADPRGRRRPHLPAARRRGPGQAAPGRHHPSCPHA